MDRATKAGVVSDWFFPRFIRAPAQVAVTMVVIADALFAQIPKEFDAAFGLDRFIGKIHSSRRGGGANAPRHTIRRGVTNSFAGMRRHGADVQGQLLVGFLEKLDGRSP